MFAAWVGEGSRILKNALADTRHLVAAMGDIPSMGLFVGPEGGFSEAEIEAFKQAEVETVSMGAHVFRMETAAIVFPALVIYELSDLQRSE